MTSTEAEHLVPVDGVHAGARIIDCEVGIFACHDVGTVRDVLDEVGARVHLKNIVVPKHIEELEQRIEELKEEKNKAVKNQQYEEAANLRDQESKLVRQLEFSKVEWEEESKVRRYPVEEDDIAEVVSMMTGIPVRKVGQSESKKLVDRKSVV